MTLTQQIAVNNNASAAAVAGKTATLAALATDAKALSLTYTWSVLSGPAGGTATFSVNRSTAAKSTVVTFTEAGTYSLTVTITDTAGNSVSSTKSVAVTPVLGR